MTKCKQFVITIRSINFYFFNSLFSKYADLLVGKKKITSNISTYKRDRNTLKLINHFKIFLYIDLILMALENELNFTTSSWGKNKFFFQTSQQF